MLVPGHTLLTFSVKCLSSFLTPQEMSQSCISWHNGRCWSILLTLAILTLFINCTSKNGTLANEISAAYEEDAISLFRELVQDLATKDFMKSDGYLLRWLRYADFDLEKAHKAFTDSINWRNENNIHNVLKEGYSSIEESYTYSINGFDREGRPVIFIPYGMYDLRKIAISGELHTFKRSNARCLELMEVYLQLIRDRTGFDNITQFVSVVDLTGFNLKQSACLQCMKMLPDFLTPFEENYPVLFHRIFAINSPAISYQAIKFGKQFLAPETNDVIKIFDFDKDEWSKALLEQISPENLPIKYGGIKLDFDKDSFAARNAAVMHLLGDGQDVSRSSVNYDNGQNSTTASNKSSQPNSDLEAKVKNSSPGPSEDTNNGTSKPEYKPTSWFDSAFTPFEWTAPDNKLDESSSKATFTDNSKQEERHPVNQNDKQKHHHHYKKVTRSDDKPEQFYSSSTENAPGFLKLLLIIFLHKVMFCCL